MILFQFYEDIMNWDLNGPQAVALWVGDVCPDLWNVCSGEQQAYLAHNTIFVPSSNLTIGYFKLMKRTYISKLNYCLYLCIFYSLCNLYYIVAYIYCTVMSPFSVIYTHAYESQLTTLHYCVILCLHFQNYLCLLSPFFFIFINAMYPFWRQCSR